MQDFIKNIEEGDFSIKIVVDGNFFNKKTILKAAYELADKVYMFFRTKGKDYLVYFRLKDEEDNLNKIVHSFGEELVYHNLRSQLDDKYGTIRQQIIQTALGFGLSLEDIEDEVKELTEKIKDLGGSQQSNIDPNNQQEKSIDDIIADIESDPNFDDEDKDEIVEILDEIEREEEDENIGLRDKSNFVEGDNNNCKSCSD